MPPLSHHVPASTTPAEGSLREDRRAEVRAALPELIARLDQIRQQRGSEAAAAIAEMRVALAAMLRAVAYVEHGVDTSSAQLGSLLRQLAKGGPLPPAVARRGEVIDFYADAPDEELRSGVFTRDPGGLCLRRLGEVALWFCRDYLRTAVPPEVAVLCHGGRPQLRLVGRAEPATDAGYSPSDPTPLPPLHPGQEEAARRLGVPAWIEDEETGIVLALIPGGEVWTGKTPADPPSDLVTPPRRRVRLRPFYIGVAPVLEREWLRVMPHLPPAAAPIGPDRAVTGVSANECRLFLTAVAGRNTLHGRHQPPLRLPSEAEWERAARGGTTTAFWWGDDWRPGWVNCAPAGIGTGELVPGYPGQYPPNGYGLYDVSGGVWEHCADDWFARPVDPSPFGLPQGGNPEDGALRGGCFSSYPASVAVSSRMGCPRAMAHYRHGFRVARDLVSPWDAGAD